MAGTLTALGIRKPGLCYWPRWSLDPGISEQPLKATYPLSTCPFFLSKGTSAEVPSWRKRPISLQLGMALW